MSWHQPAPSRYGNIKSVSRSTCGNQKHTVATKCQRFSFIPTPRTNSASSIALQPLCKDLDPNRSVELMTTGLGVL